MIKRQNVKNTYNDTKYVLSLIWKTKRGKSLITINILNSFINSIFPAALAIFPGLIINELTGKKI